MQQLTFLDLCSGIGGFRLGLESAGHRCIGYCEYDRFARASYEAMYDTEGEWKASLGGKDGKDTRKVFLSRLKGHTAFRTEEDKEKWKERNSKKSTESAE